MSYVPVFVQTRIVEYGPPAYRFNYATEEFENILSALGLAVSYYSDMSGCLSIAEIPVESVQALTDSDHHTEDEKCVIDFLRAALQTDFAEKYGVVQIRWL